MRLPLSACGVFRSVIKRNWLSVPRWAAHPDRLPERVGVRGRGAQG